MNEIRMYVERLFQGKTLTDDVIELKEEIYGNLVARYEDYLAEGMSEEEALAKTKASMTSVDDVVAGEAAADAAKAEEPVAESVVAPAKKKWVIAAVVAVAVMACLALGVKVVDELIDAREDQIEQQHDQERYDAIKKELDVRDGADEITIDSDGTIRFDGDLADELLTDVVNADAGALRPFIGTNLSDGATVEQAIHALPMSAYATDVDVTKGDGVLSLSYRDLPDYDGDSIDAALVYNATALFCMIPDALEVQITVAEADDPTDEDYYVFKSGVMAADGGYGVALNGTMLSESNWNDQIKHDHLYKKNFIERIIDQAERSAR